MSLNHLIDPLQEPKLDLYVGDVEADNAEIKNTLDVNIITTDSVFADSLITTTNPDGIIFSPLISSNKYISASARYENETYAFNSFVFNSPLYLNGWNSIGNVKTFIDVSNTLSTNTPYIETYTIKFEGNIDNNAPSVFEFRSREGYDELMDIKCQVSNNDAVGDGTFSSVGVQVLPPDDLNNDFQFRVAPVSSFGSPPLTSNATLTIDIKVLIQPPLPPP